MLKQRTFLLFTLPLLIKFFFYPIQHPRSSMVFPKSSCNSVRSGSKLKIPIKNTVKQLATTLT
jgi:hypothetical protein